jgi:adenylosuccinate synthase
MILTNTVYMRAYMAGAKTTSQPECHVDYTDFSMDGEDTVPSMYRAALNDTTAVTIGPAITTKSKRRQVNFINIHNKDTVTQTITVDTYDGTDARILVKKTLTTGQTLTWTPEYSWLVI